MKNKKTNRFAIAVAIASIPILAGCGKSNNTPPPVVTTAPGAVIGGGACIPINAAQIPMTGTNIYFDWANIRGGQIPGGMTFGQMLQGGITSGGPYQRSGVDGVISLNIIPNTATYPGGYYPGPYQGSYPGTTPSYQGPATTANLTGYVSISQVTQQDILATFGGTYGGTYGGITPYPGTMPQPYSPTNVPCVTGIAIDVGHYNNIIYGGNVYLYLNNTQHGYALYF
jgi:hypothetical protein